MKDLTNPGWIKVKGILFLLLGLAAATLLVLEHPGWKVALLLALAVALVQGTLPIVGAAREMFSGVACCWTNSGKTSSFASRLSIVIHFTVAMRLAIS